MKHERRVHTDVGSAEGIEGNEGYSVASRLAGCHAHARGIEGADHCDHSLGDQACDRFGGRVSLKLTKFSNA